MKIILLLVSLIVSNNLIAKEMYIDKGGCPGEGCRYHENWTATNSIKLHSTPDSSATIITTLSKGDSVTTMTGEVHTIPGEFLVHRVHGEFSPGDEVFVYTYLGEGWFKLSHNGKIKNVDLNFSPWGSGDGKRCEAGDRCWGTLQEDLRFFWWIKVKTQKGVEGWVLDTKDFSKPNYH